jgi:hypothetical protein
MPFLLSVLCGIYSCGGSVLRRCHAFLGYGGMISENMFVNWLCALHSAGSYTVGFSFRNWLLDVAVLGKTNLDCCANFRNEILGEAGGG